MTELSEKPKMLLEYLQARSNCAYLSDLRYLDAMQRRRLADMLESIPPEAATFDEWQDAMNYLVGRKAGSNAAEVRQQMIDALY